MLIKISFAVLFIIATVNCQKGRFEQQQQVAPAPAPRKPSYDSSGSSGQYQEDEGAAPNSVEEPEGAPEPPALVPQTSFSCEGKPYDPGMYADMEVGCTVYHMCFSGRKESFLCGTGTVFNQEILSCDHPQNVDCNSSPSFYAANEELGKPGAEPAPGGAAPAPRPRPAPRPIPQQPIPQAPRPVPSPIVRPRPQPVPQEPSYEGALSQAPAPAPRPIPRPIPQRPSKVQPPRPAPQYRPPAQQPQPAYRPAPAAPRPRPAPRPIPAPQYVQPRPVPRPQAVIPQRPSKVSPPRQPIQPQQPIVQSTNSDDDYNYEPSSQIYYQEVPTARRVQYRSSVAGNQKRRWNEYRS